MTRTIVIAGAAVLLATSAFAAPKKHKVAATKMPAKIACAVMKDHMVDVKAATASHMYADYKGSRYYFCCGGCPGAFKKDPSKYAKAAHTSIPKKG